MMPETASGRVWVAWSSAARAGSEERRAWMALSQERKVEKRVSCSSEEKRIS